MTHPNELLPERIQELHDNQFCMPCEYLDLRLKDVSFEPTGALYVAQPFVDRGVPFYDFQPAKVGDIGRDIPVRIKNMQEVEMTVKVKPHRDYYINFEEGWVDLPALGYAELPSGICVKVPWDAWGLIKTRSSTGWKKHLHVFEGTIDSAYIGALCCLVYNPHQEPIRIRDGDKLGQFILVPKYPLRKVVYVSDLPATSRGQSGFGSTGP